MLLKILTAALFAAAAIRATAQVAPEATQGGWPFAAGAGYSYFKTGITPKRLQGSTVWLDWRPGHGNSFADGFTFEAEARYLNFGQPQGQKLHQLTAGGGPVYTWRAFSNLHFYGKLLVDYGSLSHFAAPPGLPPTYTADHWTIYSFGGGLEARLRRHLWARADYEQQLWSVGGLSPLSFVKPEGITVGATYDFWRLPRAN